MKGIAINVIRQGKKYRLINFGDKSEFEIIKVLENENFLVKDLTTVEFYEFNELIQFGKGSDFSIEEI